MTTTVTFQYTTPAQPPAVEVKTIGSHTYRIGTRAMGGFFVREASSGSRLDFYSREALDWFIDQLERAAGEPLPPVIASVAAQEYKVNTVNVIRIAATTRGEIYSNVSVEEAARRFFDKHQTHVTRIRVNRFDQTIDSYNGIEVERSKSVLPGQIWVGA